MNIVVFGLTVSSSWGNGHATLWRGLCRALGAADHSVVFFERDTPYYAQHRDGTQFPGCELRFYAAWNAAASEARNAVSNADAAIVTSYCPDSTSACDLVLTACRGMRVFYDLDTPITLDRIEACEQVPYLPRGGLGDFDLVLSFAGGRALDALRTRLGARRVAPLYGAVDPAVHHPVAADARFRSHLSYLGTYASDRRGVLQELLIEPARRMRSGRFVLGGALYPDDFPWQPNIWFFPHVPPGDHPVFFSSSGLSLNVVRGPMARWGWCPSGRLFEAAACGAPQISDRWDGLEDFFTPGEEILVAQSWGDVVEAMARPRAELERMAFAARARVLEQHTATQRARELAAMLEGEHARSLGVPPADRRDDVACEEA